MKRSYPRFRRLVIVGGFAFSAVMAAQEPPRPGMLLEWVQPPATTSWLDYVKQAVADLSEFVVRSTSPDMSEDRWLWIVSKDGTNARPIAATPGARRPRWSSAGWIAYEALRDTNRDGRVDADDDLHVWLVPTNGSESVDVGRGASPIWSPDGSHVAFIRDRAVAYYDVTRKKESRTPAIGGRVVYSDQRSLAARQRTFWASDVRTGRASPLSDTGSRYLWLGAISPDGRSVVFNDNERASIRMRRVGDTKPTEVLRDGFVMIDPAWSPDGHSIVFVSTRKPSW